MGTPAGVVVPCETITIAISAIIIEKNPASAYMPDPMSRP